MVNHRRGAAVATKCEVPSVQAFESMVRAKGRAGSRHSNGSYREGYDYYCTVRAQHPNAPGKYVFTSLGLQMAFFPFEQVETISPRPLLMIVGSNADTKYFSEEAVEKANAPKELFVISGGPISTCTTDRRL
jgi:hypothetical protein